MMSSATKFRAERRTVFALFFFPPVDRFFGALKLCLQALKGLASQEHSPQCCPGQKQVEVA